MERKITPEERNILLDNPDLVMFDPCSAFRTHRLSLGRAVVLPLITLLAVSLWGILCPEFINAHPKLFAGAGCAALIISSGAVPVLYLILDNRTFRKAKTQCYARQLRALLPQEAQCGIAHVEWVIPEKAEGGWNRDGKEEMFGFCSYCNSFRIEPDTDLAVITGGRNFLAFIKRDPKTECFYRRTS